MKDAEIDWLVYHTAASLPDTDVAGIARVSGLSASVVTVSLRRLEGNLLVEYRDERVKVLSINESLFRCHLKYDADLPYTIENGVIKEKKR